MSTALLIIDVQVALFDVSPRPEEAEAVMGETGRSFWTKPDPALSSAPLGTALTAGAAPTLAARITVEGRPYTDLFTATEHTCPTFDGTAFAAQLRQRPVDLLKITPSHLRALMERSGADVLPREAVVLGGEALPEWARERQGLCVCRHWPYSWVSSACSTCARSI